MIKLKSLRWRDYPGLFRPNVNTMMVLGVKGRQESRKDVAMEAEVRATWVRELRSVGSVPSLLEKAGTQTLS